MISIETVMLGLFAIKFAVSTYLRCFLKHVDAYFSSFYIQSRFFTSVDSFFGTIVHEVRLQRRQIIELLEIS